jgi:hypothetical protein
MSFEKYQQVRVVADHDTQESNLIGMTGRIVDPLHLAEYGEQEQCNLVRLEDNRLLCFTDDEIEACKRS